MISSVVPPLTKIIQQALYKIIKKEALIVGPGIKNGMNILMDHPAQIGRDLIALAVGGIAEYKLPLAIFDLGTATTLCVVDEKKNYIGGMIMPGIKTSLNALADLFQRGCHRRHYRPRGRRARTDGDGRCYRRAGRFNRAVLQAQSAAG